VGLRGAGADALFLVAPFRFKGRISRKQYWTATLTYVFAGMFGGLLFVVLAALNYNPPDDTITNRTIIGFVLLGIAFIVFAVVIVAGLASTGIRRLHDRGKSGWWLILYYLAPDRLLGQTSFWRGAALIIPIAANHWRAPSAGLTAYQRTSPGTPKTSPSSKNWVTGISSVAPFSRQSGLG
jgi:uncharacterized membrane protein YhaH (DUF805 family)